jgi:hypothetical protein
VLVPISTHPNQEGLLIKFNQNIREAFLLKSIRIGIGWQKAPSAKESDLN